MMTRRDGMRGGFTLIELLVVIAIIALLIGILLPALGEARRTGKLTIAIAREKQMGVATGSYAADYTDLIFAFNWRGGEIHQMMDLNGNVTATQMPDGDDVGAGAMQAVHIMRSRADRTGPNGMPVPGNWIPHVLYAHLVMQDYLASRLPEELVVNPEDKVRLNWQIDPVTRFDEGFWLPLQPDPAPNNRRWPYSASWQAVPASYDVFQSTLGPAGVGRRIQQGGQHSNYTIPGGVKVGGLRIGDVAYTSNKVHMMDPHQRHFGNDRPYYGLEQSRIPLLFFDGAVSVERTADSNPGWRPNAPTFPCMTFWYQPDEWEPETTNGEFQEFMKGHYRWTRGGLKGVDFGGKPLDTGQPDPGECDL